MLHDLLVSEISVNPLSEAKPSANVRFMANFGNPAVWFWAKFPKLPVGSILERSKTLLSKWPKSRKPGP